MKNFLDFKVMLRAAPNNRAHLKAYLVAYTPQIPPPHKNTTKSTHTNNTQINLTETLSYSIVK